MLYKETPQIPCCSVKVQGDISSLQQLLEKLLTQWGISPELPGHDTLEIHASHSDQQLRLLPGEVAEDSLPLPIRIEELWLALQPHLYDPPRQHFRVPLRIRGRLQQTDLLEPFLSVSLSDAGLRLEFTRELARESEVKLEIPLGAKSVSLLGKVIYSVPTRASDSMITGIAFTPHQEETKSLVREFLVEQTLRQTAQQMEHDTFLEALAYLRLPEYTRNRLKQPA